MTDYWEVVLKRDPDYDGQFVYAVRSTGVYCRPSCPSRRPNRDQVRFFATPQDAAGAGFRPCRRCQPDQAVPDERHLDLIREVCRYLDETHETAPTLDELADRFNLSPYHLQRTFKRIVGITPRQYAAAHRLERFKDELRDGKTVTDALYDAGYQSSSSAYEESLGMSPRSYQQGGSGMQIAYTAVPCPLGWLLVAATEKGLCAVRLGDSGAGTGRHTRQRISWRPHRAE